MNLKQTCTISAATYSYQIEISEGLLADPEPLAKFIEGLSNKVAIIADKTTAELFATNLAADLFKYGLDATVFSFADGEVSKTRHTKETIEDQMLERGFGRDSCVLALGGGITMDIAGFVASTFCRGVPFVAVPTSLLAMVDASIGGKTGINTSFGKNLIGSIYQPKKVFIDPAVLTSLPLKEVRNGIAEMVKHAIIADAEYFNFLEDNIEEILSLSMDYLKAAIFESCRIKSWVVESDEKEKSIRRLLNFGHTIGHAIEKVTQYAVPHGKAVAIGMIVESAIAVDLGYLDQDVFFRIQNLLNRYYQSLQLTERISFSELWKAMQHDKKSENGDPRIVMITNLGEVQDFEGQYCRTVSEEVVEKALNAILKRAEE